MSSTTYGKGNYSGQVLDQGFEETANNVPYFYLQFQILGRLDKPGQPCPQYERDCRWYISTEEGVRRLREDLRSLGLEFSRLTELEPTSAGAKTLVGRQIELSCSLEFYQGHQRERFRIRRTRSIGLDKLRELDAKFGDQGDLGSPKAPEQPQNPTSASA